MFTGLIETVGTISRVGRSAGTAVLSVSATLDGDPVAIGDSIAINGVCLTVTALSGGIFSFDVSPETLERSSLRSAMPGTAVNVERALRLSDRLGGHLVTGHVDCMATIVDLRRLGGNIIFVFRLPREFARYIGPKGSVTIDGISLTVNDVGEDWFSVNIIPHTGASTTLRHRKRGDDVNIETDILAKYVERLLKSGGTSGGGGVTLDLLAKSGYL